MIDTHKATSPKLRSGGFGFGASRSMSQFSSSRKGFCQTATSEQKLAEALAKTPTKPNPFAVPTKGNQRPVESNTKTPTKPNPFIAALSQKKAAQAIASKPYAKRTVTSTETESNPPKLVSKTKPPTVIQRILKLEAQMKALQAAVDTGKKRVVDESDDGGGETSNKRAKTATKEKATGWHAAINNYLTGKK